MFTRAAARERAMLRQIEGTDYTSGKKVELRFKPDERVEGGKRAVEHSAEISSVTVANIERVAYQFLYRQGDILHLMDQTTFEQIEMDASVLGDRAAFLQGAHPAHCRAQQRASQME